MNTGTLPQTDLSQYAPIIVGAAKTIEGSGSSDSRQNVTSLGEYLGKPVINMANPNEKGRPFTVGMSKAKTILANIKQLEAFVKSEGKSIEVA